MFGGIFGVSRLLRSHSQNQTASIVSCAGRLHNEGFFGQAVAGHGTTGLTLVAYAQSYRRILANLHHRSEGPGGKGYSDPITNKSYSAKIELESRQAVTLDRKKCVALNRARAEERAGPGGFSPSIRALACDQLSHSKQSRIRVFTKEKPGSKPLHDHYTTTNDAVTEGRSDPEPADPNSDDGGGGAREGLGPDGKEPPQPNSVVRPRRRARTRPMTHWGAGTCVAFETSQRDGYVFFGVLQDTLEFKSAGKLDPVQETVQIVWLDKADPSTRYDQTSGGEFIAMAEEGEVEDAETKPLIGRFSPEDVHSGAGPGEVHHMLRRTEVNKFYNEAVRLDDSARSKPPADFKERRKAKDYVVTQGKDQRAMAGITRKGTKRSRGEDPGS